MCMVRSFGDFPLSVSIWRYGEKRHSNPSSISSGLVVNVMDWRAENPGSNPSCALLSSHSFFSSWLSFWVSFLSYFSIGLNERFSYTSLAFRGLC